MNVAERLDRNHFTPIVGVKYTADSPLEARLRDLGIEVIQIDLAVPPRPYTTLPLRARRAGRELRRELLWLIGIALPAHLAGAVIDWRLILIGPVAWGLPYARLAFC